MTKKILKIIILPTVVAIIFRVSAEILIDRRGCGNSSGGLVVLPDWLFYYVPSSGNDPRESILMWIASLATLICGIVLLLKYDNIGRFAKIGYAASLTALAILLTWGSILQARSCVCF